MNPTERLETVKAADLARLTEADWQKQRNKMLDTCADCHARSFAKAELEKGDDMIKSADRLMAQAIRIVADLYKDGVLQRPEGYMHAFPDLFTFHDAPTPVEQRLFVMFLKHRMRAFQGTFHANPDYALWYGWSEMQRDLTEIAQALPDVDAERVRRETSAGRNPVSALLDLVFGGSEQLGKLQAIGRQVQDRTGLEDVGFAEVREAQFIRRQLQKTSEAVERAAAASKARRSRFGEKDIQDRARRIIPSRSTAWPTSAR